MAKRKRLTPADPSFLGAGAGTGSTLAHGTSSARAPIADVAGDASASAALEEVSQTLRQARETGRMLLEIPLDQVQADYLVRDRQSVNAEETAALMDSLRNRGQQTPIEVMALDEGRYGLISGWRRLDALRRLQKAGGTTDTVLALLRRPEQAAEAYQAMVEENEIRVGLSYYERARIVAKAVEEDVFDTEKQALQTLFSTASRAKRSKIKSFLSIVRALDGALRFPEAIGERAGLTLAKALGEDESLPARLHAALIKASPADIAAELACLGGTKKQTLLSPLESEKHPSHLAVPEISTMSSGVRVEIHDDGRVILGGTAKEARFREDLMDWLAMWR